MPRRGQERRGEARDLLAQDHLARRCHAGTCLRKRLVTGPLPKEIRVPRGNKRAWDPSFMPCRLPFTHRAGRGHTGRHHPEWRGPSPARGAQTWLAAHAGQGAALGSKLPGLVPPKDYTLVASESRMQSSGVSESCPGHLLGLSLYTVGGSDSPSWSGVLVHICLLRGNAGGTPGYPG